MDHDELAFLVRRGESFISSGDLAAARLMLQRAAEAGDVHAALALAGTYDPNTIETLGIQGLAAHEAMARLWYERARASARLKRRNGFSNWRPRPNVLP
jgi:TPR repeat protein